MHLRVNRKVSNVWIVVVLSFSLTVILLWYTHVVIEDIDNDTFYIVSTQYALE